MEPASVGFQCPECVSRGRASIRAPRTAVGARLRSSGTPVTFVLIGICAGLYLVNLVLRGVVLGYLALDNASIMAAGEYWRLLTYGFTSVGLLQLAMNMLVLFLAGRALEPQLAGWRLAGLYLLAGFGGATLLFVFGPITLAAVGGSAAVIGLLAANGALKLKRHEDVRGDIGLLVLLLLYSFVVGRMSYNWLGILGGIVVGGLVGLVLVHAPRQRRTSFQVLGLAGVTLLCCVAVAARMLL